MLRICLRVGARFGIQARMRFPLLPLALLSTLLTGCTTSDRSPEAIRRDTAVATSTAARDAKAVAEGVVDGLRKPTAVNINDASQAELERLPGIDAVLARRIIASRPYGEPVDLLKRHVLSKPEYDPIGSRIVTR